MITLFNFKIVQNIAAEGGSRLVQPVKGLFKRIKHVGQTLSNMLIKHVGQTLLDTTCLTLLNSTIKHVGRCWMKFDFVRVSSKIWWLLSINYIKCLSSHTKSSHFITKVCSILLESDFL